MKGNKTACARQAVFISVGSGAVAFLELFAAAARARVVAANVFQGIAHRLLVSVTAIWTVDMAVVMIRLVVVVMIVVAVRAMDMGLLGHAGVTPE